MPQCKCGSYAINHHHHGRDGDDGHLCDVCYWRTRAELLLAERDALAKAAIRYDEAIQSCANDPDRMSSHCTAEGDDLDALYEDWLCKALLIDAQIEQERSDE